VGAAAAGGRDGGDNAATAADAGGIADVAGARGVTAGLLGGSDGRVLAVAGPDCPSDGCVAGVGGGLVGAFV
jgi:hypothetical protein